MCMSLNGCFGRKNALSNTFFGKLTNFAFILPLPPMLPTLPTRQTFQKFLIKDSLIRGVRGDQLRCATQAKRLKVKT